MLGTLGSSPGNLETKEGGPTSHFLRHWPHPALGCPGSSTSSSSEGCTPEPAGQEQGQTRMDRFWTTPGNSLVQPYKALAGREGEEEGENPYLVARLLACAASACSGSHG